MRERQAGQGVGNDLRSQEVSLPVPSALAGLTVGFEMEPGVPPPPGSPTPAVLTLTTG